MARPTIAGNWKMNTSLAEAKSLASTLRASIGDMSGIDRVLCPPFPYLTLVREAVAGSSIGVSAQNMSYQEKGAFTGEVAPNMVAELCDYVILGHSERRALYAETDESVNLKVEAALKAGLKPIICVGETLAQREVGTAESVVERQIIKALDGVDNASSLVIAYEPVWAIGTGVPATPELAVEIMGGVIQRNLIALYGEPAALEVPLLYGGSVTADSVQGFVEQACIHGALVGGASLKAEEFAQIVRTTAQVKGVS
jgi:triosephosphate isomerase